MFEHVTAPVFKTLVAAEHTLGGDLVRRSRVSSLRPALIKAYEEAEQCHDDDVYNSDVPLEILNLRAAALNATETMLDAHYYDGAWINLKLYWSI